MQNGKVAGRLENLEYHDPLFSYYKLFSTVVRLFGKFTISL